MKPASTYYQPGLSKPPLGPPPNQGSGGQHDPRVGIVRVVR